MNELFKENYNFTLYEKDDQLLLIVLCGSAAMFEVEYILASEDVAAYKEEGIEYIKRLVKDIQYNPKAYLKK